MALPDICRDYRDAHYAAYMDDAKCEPCGDHFLIVTATGGWNGYTAKDVRNLTRRLRRIAEQVPE